MRTIALILILCLTTPALAEEMASPDGTTDVRIHDADVDPHPILSSSTIWMGATAIIILGLFLAAGIIGPVVRAELPGEVPDAFSHTEDPSHHKGSEHAMWESSLKK